MDREDLNLLSLSTTVSWGIRGTAQGHPHVPSPTPSLDLGFQGQRTPGCTWCAQEPPEQQPPRKTPSSRGWRIHRLTSRERHACPAHPGMLEITSRTLTAVMYDAEDPCSVNAAYEPESSFTTTPRSTTRPLYVWNFLSSSKFCKMNCFAFFLCLYKNLLFAFLTSHSCHAGKLFSFSHSSSTAAFAFGFFHCLGHRTKFAHKIVMTHEIVPFFGNMIFMIFLSLWNALLVDS